MNRLMMAMAIVAMGLAACGGGSGDSGSTGTSAPTMATAAPKKLESYLGTWTTACQDHNTRGTAVITRVSDQAIAVAYHTDYYLGSDCSGSVYATLTPSAAVTLTYVSTDSASVVLPPDTVPSVVSVDRISAMVAESRTSLTAPETTTRTVGDHTEKCATVNGTISLCLDESQVSPAYASSGALLVRDNKLYQMLPDVTGLHVDAVSTRK